MKTYRSKTIIQAAEITAVNNNQVMAGGETYDMHPHWMTDYTPQVGQYLARPASGGDRFWVIPNLDNWAEQRPKKPK